MQDSHGEGVRQGLGQSEVARDLQDYEGVRQGLGQSEVALDLQDCEGVRQGLGQSEAALELQDWEGVRWEQSGVQKEGKLPLVHC